MDDGEELPDIDEDFVPESERMRMVGSLEVCVSEEIDEGLWMFQLERELHSLEVEAELSALTKAEAAIYGSGMDEAFIRLPQHQAAAASGRCIRSEIS